MNILFTILFFIAGLIIGSFLNVVIYRLNSSKTILGRSQCMVCQNKLRFWDLIPVFSFLFLRGRCRDCKSRISIQYPIIELISGLIFLGLFFKFRPLIYLDSWIFVITFAYFAIMFSILIIISVYDLKHRIISDLMVFIFGLLALAGLFFFSNGQFNVHWPSGWDFLSGAIISIPFALIWLVSRGRWMGLGDAKLAVGLGWLLGIWPLISSVILAFWIGALAGVGLIILSKKYSIKSEIPFAPFLVLGALLAFLFGIQLF